MRDLNKQAFGIACSSLSGKTSVNVIAVHLDSDGILVGVQKGFGQRSIIESDQPTKLTYKGNDVIVPPSWYSCACTEDTHMGDAFKRAMDDWIMSRLLKSQEFDIIPELVTFVSICVPERAPWSRDLETLEQVMTDIFSKYFCRLYLSIRLVTRAVDPTKIDLKRLLVLRMDGEWTEFLIPNLRKEKDDCYPAHLGFRRNENRHEPVSLRMNELGQQDMVFWHQMDAKSWDDAFETVWNSMKAELWKLGHRSIHKVVVIAPADVHPKLQNVLKRYNMGGYHYFYDRAWLLKCMLEDVINTLNGYRETQDESKATDFNGLFGKNKKNNPYQW